MSRANSSSTRISYLMEATENTIPATPAWQRVRSTGETLNIKLDAQRSQELEPNRNVADEVTVSQHPSGGLNFEFSHASFEDFLSMALRAPWVTNQLVNGTTKLTAAFEVAFETGATDIYKRITGAQLDKIKFEFKPKSMVTGSFDIMGRNGVFDNAPVAAATYVAPNTEVVMVAGLDFASFSMAGLTIDCVPMLTMEINNNLRSLYCLDGTNAPIDNAPGDCDVTGDIEFFLDENKYPLLQAYTANSATSINFTLGRTTLKKTAFEFPRVKLSDLQVVAQGNNQDVIIKAKWRALRSLTVLTPSTNQGSVRITRNVV
jgi:hypothetical protein